MRALGLKAKAGRKYKVTTDSKHALPIAPNLLGQDFTHTHASAPNQVWLSDITYLWTKEGWTFVACMLDLFTREIVGWAIDSHMRKSLVHDALKMAEFRNGFTQKSGVRLKRNNSTRLPPSMRRLTTTPFSIGSRAQEAGTWLSQCPQIIVIACGR